MRSMLMLFIIAAFLTLPAWGEAATENDFQVVTTQNLINLCTASQGDPLYHQAVNFCHGYLVGAYKFYEAEHSGPNAARLVCLPVPPPTRNEAIQMFITWAQAHPEYMQEKPVETEFRFMVETWPCKQ